MSALAELLGRRRQDQPAANPANPANPANSDFPSRLISNFSNFSSADIRDPRASRRADEERRREIVLGMMAAGSALQRYYWHTELDGEFVVVAVAIRGVGTFELWILRERYDPFRLLEIIRSQGRSLDEPGAGEVLMSGKKRRNALVPLQPLTYDVRSKGGRPTKYRREFAHQAEQLCILGATDMELARFFGCDAATLYRWRGRFPEFCESLKAGKSAADDRVERALYGRAVGYDYRATRITQSDGQPVAVEFTEHVPADPVSAFFWLKNRRPYSWRDRREVLSAHVHRVEQVLSDDELLAIAKGVEVDDVAVEKDEP